MTLCCRRTYSARFALQRRFKKDRSLFALFSHSARRYWHSPRSLLEVTRSLRSLAPPAETRFGMLHKFKCMQATGWQTIHELSSPLFSISSGMSRIASLRLRISGPQLSSDRSTDVAILKSSTGLMIRYRFFLLLVFPTKTLETTSRDRSRLNVEARGYYTIPYQYRYC